MRCVGEYALHSEVPTISIVTTICTGTQIFELNGSPFALYDVCIELIRKLGNVSSSCLGEIGNDKLNLTGDSIDHNTIAPLVTANSYYVAPDLCWRTSNQAGPRIDLQGWKSAHWICS